MQFDLPFIVAQPSQISQQVLLLKLIQLIKALHKKKSNGCVFTGLHYLLCNLFLAFRRQSFIHMGL